MAALIGIGIQVHGGAVGHLCTRVRILVGDSCCRLTGGAFGQLMPEALDVQLHLRTAPLGAHQIRHSDHSLTAILAVGGNAKVGCDLADDVAHNGRCQQ